MLDNKNIFVQRVFQDSKYLPSNLPKLKKFFIYYLLPEILTHKLLSDSVSSSTMEAVSSQSNGDKYCLCRKGEFGHMIFCDNLNCTIQWYHFSCVGLKEAPVGKWYCPTCNNW